MSKVSTIKQTVTRSRLACLTRGDFALVRDAIGTRSQWKQIAEVLESDASSARVSLRLHGVTELVDEARVVRFYKVIPRAARGISERAYVSPETLEHAAGVLYGTRERLLAGVAHIEAGTFNHTALECVRLNLMRTRDLLDRTLDEMFPAAGRRAAA